MTYREKCLKEAEDELRRSGLLKDGETLEEYNQQLLDDAHVSCLQRVDDRVQKASTREELLENTRQKIHDARQDPNTGDIDVDPHLVVELFGPGVVQDG